MAVLILESLSAEEKLKRNKYYQKIYDAGGYGMPYLGQIALQFEITPEIPVYVRIHIQDQWESERFTTDSESTKTIISKELLLSII